ncbi:MAG: GNAT family N-acetyltransferase [Halobacteria archaeon]
MSNRFIERRYRVARPYDLTAVVEIEKECFDENHVALLSRICGFTEHIIISERTVGTGNPVSEKTENHERYSGNPSREGPGTGARSGEGSETGGARGELEDEEGMDNVGEGVDVSDTVVEGYVLTGLVGQDVGRVVSLAVRERFRRSGVGSGLMEQALANLDEMGVETVELEVRRSNEPAISLYRDIGFEIKGWKKGYYSDGEDAALMKIILK